jgi:DNA (cytosine-5)-methyltransferase 1
MAEPVVVDLFAGAGGLSIGARLAGLKVAGCIELDGKACQTLQANKDYHGDVLKDDVSRISGDDLRKHFRIGKKQKLLVVGGAPCQPFSKAAYWVEEGEEAAYRRDRARGVRRERPQAPTEAREDERRDLVKEFWRLIRDSNADGFVFENVTSIKHPRNKPIYDSFVRSARKAGYEITEVEANAADYGVPQTRQRVFILGSRKRAPIHPEPTHYLDDAQASLFRQPAVTAGEALDGLGTPDLFEPEEVVSGRWAQHLAEVPPGWNYKAHTAWAGHPNPTFVTETRFWNFLLKLSPDRPSWTIAASPGPWTGPFHWESRRLRTAELAALQSFPRGYHFAGSRRDRVRQIGNAVPPLLARAMVQSVADAT